MFRDRAHAGERLATALAGYRGRRPLVLGIPRGGVPIARIIADRLEGELDVVLVHKLGFPGNPEYAVGAVSESGDVTLREDSRDLLSLGEGYVEAEAREQVGMLRRRRRLYTPGRGSQDPAGRVVIVVDDGSATGETMLAALRVVRPLGPAELVAAMPVAAADTLPRLQAAADRVVVLEAPRSFWAVGAHYTQFRQVSDDEVIDALRSEQSRPEEGAKR